jgi:uncharacterized membrane-anchored protein
MNSAVDVRSSKVPEITLIFWIIKILATTLGETGGDSLSMQLDLGYAVSTAIFFAIFLVLVGVQISTNRFHAFLYWAVIVATTTAGTTMADFADRSLVAGYAGVSQQIAYIVGSTTLLLALIAVLAAWHFAVGSISFSQIVSRKVEFFYWLTILFSNTLGTALGDFFADTSGLGYEGAAFVFSGLLLVLAALYFFTSISRTFLFWAAFILTRPLGATLGDILTKRIDQGGLNLSRIDSSVVIAIVMVLIIALAGRRAGGHPATQSANTD